jgi:serine/threonine-protein kinase
MSNDDPSGPKPTDGSPTTNEPPRTGTGARRRISESAATMAVAEDLLAEGGLGLEPPGTERYEKRSLLGEGGMGAVMLCRDRRIGRDIAMKTVREDAAARVDLAARFLHEARIQGQLEHPAIVPVYDVGLDAVGAPYFTMKRVVGATLDEILGYLAGGNAQEARRYSTRKLLAAFASVCLAMDFAHGRGAVHRDLKPANIMLGDYGEVYVLDWGVAKILGAEDAPLGPMPGVPMGSAPRTHHGSVLGTPGYMAPEQITRGHSVDARTDVYALGALLFEILTLEQLHSDHDPNERIASTIRGVEARPSVRAPERDVAPELEAIVVKATARDPKDRHATARELQEAVERYLEGDRDVTLRRQMAEQHATLAAEAAELAISGHDPDQAVRKRAMREVGHALALDPTSVAGLRTMVRLLLEPPKELPKEVSAELAELARVQIRVGGRTGALAYASILAYVAIFALMGVRSPPLVALIIVAIIATAATSFGVSTLRAPETKHAVIVLAVGTVLYALLSSVFGPFIRVQFPTC